MSLYQQRLSKDKTKQNRKSLESYIKQLNGIMSKKNEVYSHTLEGYASSIKNEYIICNTLYQNNNKVFSTDIKNDENSYTLFNNIVNY